MDKTKPDERPTASATPPASTKDQLRDKCCLTCDASSFKDPTKAGLCKLKPPQLSIHVMPTGVAPNMGPPVALQDVSARPVVQPDDFCIEGYIAKGTERIPGIKTPAKP